MSLCLPPNIVESFSKVKCTEANHINYVFKNGSDLWQGADILYHYFVYLPIVEQWVE